VCVFWFEGSLGTITVPISSELLISVYAVWNDNCISERVPSIVC
jgi:hypothetical protein